MFSLSRYIVFIIGMCLFHVSFADDPAFPTILGTQPTGASAVVTPTDVNNAGSYNTALGTMGTSNPSQTATPSPDTDSNNILGIEAYRLRTGDIGMKDIPIMIASAVEYLMALAGSIAVVALIYHAVRMQLASGITGDSSGVDKAKRGMKGAGLGFILAMSAWFIMTRLVELLSSI